MASFAAHGGVNKARTSEDQYVPKKTVCTEAQLFRLDDLLTAARTRYERTRPPEPLAWLEAKRTLSSLGPDAPLRGLVLAVSCGSSPDSWVYFVGTSEVVKIGTSKDVEKRFTALQAASPAQLTPFLVIVGDRWLEYTLQAIFKDDRRHGEWFGLTPRIADFIASMDGQCN